MHLQARFHWCAIIVVAFASRASAESPDDYEVVVRCWPIGTPLSTCETAIYDCCTGCCWLGEPSPVCGTCEAPIVEPTDDVASIPTPDVRTESLPDVPKPSAEDVVVDAFEDDMSEPDPGVVEPVPPLVSPDDGTPPEQHLSGDLDPLTVEGATSPPAAGGCQNALRGEPGRTTWLVIPLLAWLLRAAQTRRRSSY